MTVRPSDLDDVLEGGVTDRDWDVLCNEINDAEGSVFSSSSSSSGESDSDDEPSTAASAASGEKGSGRQVVRSVCSSVGGNVHDVSGDGGGGGDGSGGSSRGRSSERSVPHASASASASANAIASTSASTSASGNNKRSTATRRRHDGSRRNGGKRRGVSSSINSAPKYPHTFAAGVSGGSAVPPSASFASEYRYRSMDAAPPVSYYDHYGAAASGGGRRGRRGSSSSGGGGSGRARGVSPPVPRFGLYGPPVSQAMAPAPFHAGSPSAYYSVRALHPQEPSPLPQYYQPPPPPPPPLPTTADGEGYLYYLGDNRGGGDDGISYSYSSSEAYRYAPYCRLRSDQEYLVPKATSWFDKAIDFARNKEGQRMLSTMFVRCPYYVEDLDAFILFLESQAVPPPAVDEDETMESERAVDRGIDEVDNDAEEKKKQQQQQQQLEIQQKQDAVVEMLTVTRFISLVYAYYETEQLKNGVQPTKYVNRIVNARDIQNGKLDCKTSPGILVFFAQHWARLCGRTTERVMNVYWNQRRNRK